MTVDHGWNYETCFLEGMKKGYTPEQIRDALKELTDVPDSVEAAYVESMYEGLFKMPEHIYRKLWGDYRRFCGVNSLDFGDYEIINGWIWNECGDYTYYIRPDDTVKTRIKKKFIEYLRQSDEEDSRHSPQSTLAHEKTPEASSAAVPAGGQESVREHPQPVHRDGSTCHICGYVSIDKAPKFCPECGNRLIK